MLTIPKKTVIAIPAYRAEKELKLFLPNLLKTVPSNQVVVLIDGVYDNSAELCDSLNIKTITHQENRGKGAALSTLFKELSSEFEWIVTLDADGQHSPDDLVNFISKFDSDCSIIVGSRDRSKSSMPLARRFSNATTSAILSLFTGQKIDDSQCGYRAYKTEILKRVQCRSTKFDMESEILIRASKLKLKICNTPIKTIYQDEESHISHVVDTIRWVKTVLKTQLERVEGR